MNIFFSKVIVSICFLSLAITPQLLSQINMSIYKTECYSVDYPKNWKIETGVIGKTNRVQINVPTLEQQGFSYISIYRDVMFPLGQDHFLYFMHEYLGWLRYETTNRDDFIKNLKINPIEIDNISGYFIDFSSEDKIDLSYTLSYDEYSIIKIKIYMKKNDYERNKDAIEYIKNSIKINTSGKIYSYITPSIISQDSFETIIQDEKRSKELDLLLLRMENRDIKIKIVKT